MENIQTKLLDLNDSLRSLNLEPKKESEGNNSDLILVGKVLATRTFRLFTIAEIVTKIWRIREPVKVDKLENNMFKFLFGCILDRNHIYQNRPWSLDAVHLILKFWPENKILREIPFDTTTLWLQIHGLPPAIFHEGITEKIGRMVGILHQQIVNKRCVISHIYLRVRVDIYLKNPILAAFFYDRVGDDALWVQLKYERLPNFYFRCGFLDHVIGRCNYEKSTMISSAYGVTLRVFGPWLKVEVARNLNFVNLMRKAMTGEGLT